MREFEQAKTASNKLFLRKHGTRIGEAQQPIASRATN